MIPSVVATFVAALACTGQTRWDNFKTLLMDTSVTTWHQQRKVPLIEAVDPSQPFRKCTLVPNTLARSARTGEELDKALSDFTENGVRKFFTPVAEWLYEILLPVFNEQFPEDAMYDSEFDVAEVMLGLVSEDQMNQFSQRIIPSNRAYAYSHRWFGRSTMPAQLRHSHALKDVWEQQAVAGADWGPIRAGLFGGAVGRASQATSSYAQIFNLLMGKQD
jgi:hypothetical protein